MTTGDPSRPRSGGEAEESPRDLGAELAGALEGGLWGARALDPSRRPSPTSDVRPGAIVLAWSGGLDSTVLLHLLACDDRVKLAVGDVTIVAAHLDHAMRPDSRSVADAVRRTAEAWGVEFRSHRLSTPPGSEEAARTQRYRWLSEVADEAEADEIWTAHHADDQAETVLFRALRGTGVAGLAGIPVRRERIRRPLLMLSAPVWRADLTRYGEAHRLPVRIDPSNQEAVATRNRLRNEVMPLLDRVVPGSAEALLRLARNAARAAEEVDALAELALSLLEDAGVSEHESVARRGSTSVQTPGPDSMPTSRASSIGASVWEEAGRPLRRALVRHLAARSGVALSEAATRAVLDLPPDTQSGRGVDLPGGLRFERDFDRWYLVRPTEVTVPASRADQIRIDQPGPGSARLGLGGRVLVAEWSTEGTESAAGPSEPSLRVDVQPSRFPLTLRGWEPGDRIARDFGTTPVAKVWAERRVPRRERAHRWVLADRRNTVLAAEGLGAASRDRTIEGSNPTPVTLHLRLDVEA